MNIAIKTYGCAMNQADSEMLAGLLKEHGFEISNFQDSDIVIVNTCTVKAPTENKILKKLKELEASDKEVIVSGCMPSAIPELVNKFPKFSFIGVNVFDIVDAVLCVKEGKRFIKINQTKEDRYKISIPKLRRNRVIEIVPIAEGCVGECTYCQTKLARGNLNSYPEELILKQIQTAVKQKVKEVWITSQDNGAYGLDLNNNKNLPELLNKISEIDGNFKVRVGMANPNHVLKFLNELVDIYKNDNKNNFKFYKFLHIPLQSGDDDVLKDMNRKYNACDFKKIVKEFRNKIKGVTISTDIICGFPTETEESFKNTIKLLRKTEPNIVNISRYWKREGTKAAEMKQHPGKVTKNRSRIINKIFKEIALKNNKKWIGWQGRALVSKKGKNSSWTARNFAYKPIIIKSNENLLGKEIDVKITDATFYDFRCEIV